MEEYKNIIEYKTRGVRFGEIKVTFKRKEKAEKVAMKKFDIGRLGTFSIYMGRCAVRVSMGRIPSEIDRGLMIAAAINNIENVELIQVSQIKQLDWWGYDIEMHTLIEEGSMLELLETLNLPEDR